MRKEFVMRKSKAWIPTSTDRAIYDDIKAHARAMRKHPTPAEELLWQQLRGNKVMDYSFRRQHPIDRFIVDFYCRDARLVIEVDGSVHHSTEAIEYDKERQQFLEERGLTVLRFSNADVINNHDIVICRISDYLTRLGQAESNAPAD